MQSQYLLKLFVALALIPAARGAAGLELTGAGSTFAYPVLSRWADAYFKETGDKVNYQSIGSGGGVKQIERRLVDFAATDVALDEAQLKAKNLHQFPITAGELTLPAGAALAGVEDDVLVVNLTHAPTAEELEAELEEAEAEAGIERDESDEELAAEAAEGEAAEGEGSGEGESADSGEGDSDGE